MEVNLCVILVYGFGIKVFNLMIFLFVVSVGFVIWGEVGGDLYVEVKLRGDDCSFCWCWWNI